MVSVVSVVIGGVDPTLRRRNDGIDLPRQLLSLGEKDKWALLNYSIDHENAHHDNHDRAKRKTEVTFVPPDVLHRVPGE